LIGEKETRIGHATIGTLPLAAQLASLKGEANAWLSGESYDALRHRLEDTHASVEAAAVEGGEVQGASVLQDHLQPNQRAIDLKTAVRSGEITPAQACQQIARRVCVQGEDRLETRGNKVINTFHFID
jgi:hypothetical protein